jgi:hypothetical protein
MLVMYCGFSQQEEKQNHLLSQAYITFIISGCYVPRVEMRRFLGEGLVLKGHENEAPGWFRLDIIEVIEVIRESELVQLRPRRPFGK